MKREGYPHTLVVKFKVVNYTFNLDPNETYCGFCWVTVGVDIRGSIMGKNYNATPEMNGDSWVLCANLFYVKLNPDGSLQYSKKNEILLKCRDLDYGIGIERLYHYSIATLDSKGIELGKWINITILIGEYAHKMENQFNFRIDRVHLIQPFIETCGGSIEAHFDMVWLH